MEIDWRLFEECYRYAIVKIIGCFKQPSERIQKYSKLSSEPDNTNLVEKRKR